MKTATLGFLATALLAGCATPPPSDDDLTWTPPYRYLNPEYLRHEIGTGEVVVMNGTHLVCDTRLYIDGRGAVNFDDYEKVLLFLPPGEHVLSVQPRGFCRDMGNTSTASVPVHIVPGQAAQRFHIRMSTDGRVAIAP